MRWLGGGLIGAGAVALVLTGCSGAQPRPPGYKGSVIDPPSTPGGQTTGNSTQSVSPQYGPELPLGRPYTVASGDTLYAIAFRLGVDFRALAAHNKISPPYTIFVGQRLKTDIGSSPNVDRAPSTTGSGRNTSAPSSGASSGSTARAQSGSSAGTAASSRVTSGNQPVGRWRWPSEGTVVRVYAEPVHKGIDISGTRGAAVVAVADGVVVYAGTGVTGYGALLIVKHNDQYLSAYGHNDTILVREGAPVKAGQTIARMGSSGTDSVKLHFEIRSHGKPVDPLRMLPRR
jgi:lipoprotein NlpD